MDMDIVVVSYVVGDGATYSAEVVVPVAAGSVEAFTSAFDSAMAAYEPGGRERFSLFGEVFEYRHFIEWRGGSQGRPATYDCVSPTVQTLNEWVAECRARSAKALLLHGDGILIVEEDATMAAGRRP